MDTWLAYINTFFLLPTAALVLAWAAGIETNLWRRAIKLILCAVTLVSFYGFFSALWSHQDVVLFLQAWLQPSVSIGISSVMAWAYLDWHRTR